MRIALALIAATLPAAAAPAWAQEVILTSQRRGYNNDAVYSDGVVATSRPIINLRRAADYAVQNVRVAGDARDAATRRNDLHATIRNMLDAAARGGVELATGNYVIEPLTAANYKNLPLQGDGRPDTDQANFLIKVRLAEGMDLKAAEDRIARFVNSVPKAGRTQVSVSGMTVSVVDPDQYRGQIIDLIAADAAISAGKFGTGSGVDVTGLDRPVEWARGSGTEVFLFLPASYVVRKR
ncbi:SIMPL domain-containing protein [Allosphingosinicella deserti]|uniref:TonB-dependent receptor n=1 Tax=Allosphingosinicella deserti TaxID=2116704 RepID=A0A2P7QEW4_9SPHN|nr:SIMPL domain-containing protein [Sphingomonas deserti]PSJ36518.1 TonB-dependent receptor [Sphingomonas deserti]